jgi:hypothetical protein
MELPPGYRVERICRDNYRDFVIIHLEAFKSNITSDFPMKKFNTLELAGVENIGYIVYSSDGSPVSYYGVYPLYALIDGNRVLISQSGDTMTIPEHTGLGLFIHTAVKTNELCRQIGIKGLFGFPSPPSYRTFRKKLDWKFKENIIRYKFNVPALPIAYFAEKSQFLKRIYLGWVRMVLSLCRKADIFEGSVTGNGQNGVLRNKQYWNYKLSGDDIFCVRLYRTDVVLKTNGVLSIGDIDIRKETDLLPILRRLKLLAFLTFNFQIIFYMSPGTQLDEKLSVITKSSQSLPVGYLNLDDEHDLSSLKFTYLDFDTF